MAVTPFSRSGPFPTGVAADVGYRGGGETMTVRTFTLPEPLPQPNPARRLGSSTPLRLLAIAVGLIAAILLAGTVTAFTVGERRQVLSDLLARAEPLSDSVQELYSELSVADAAASTGFIYGGVEPVEVRERYTTALSEASAAAALASNGMEDDAGRESLLLISRQLPVYAGLIETARANNRLGNPVGSAYLAEASALMQNTLLPAANSLYEATTERVGNEQRMHSGRPWPAIIAVLFAVVVCLAAVPYLARLTGRKINLGVAIAGGTMGVALCWLLVAGLMSSIAATRAVERGIDPLDALTDSRILAQTARSNETLGMVRRSPEEDVQFGPLIDQLREHLDGIDRSVVPNEQLDQVTAVIDEWVESHERITEALLHGDFSAASGIAVDPGIGGSAALFDRLDGELVALIEDSRTNLRDNVDQATRILRGITQGVVLLSAIAVLAVAFGMRNRLREYQ
ncbi:hypothetical protein [Millisia brevis]|uniref:hypothetical protein n=1 Tax=Millisia brevis TaxID=264148 RepID=UPI0012ECC543|nr:hypothetical protein [Millisia brevis]